MPAPGGGRRRSGRASGRAEAPEEGAWEQERLGRRFPFHSPAAGAESRNCTERGGKWLKEEGRPGCRSRAWEWEGGLAGGSK